MRSNFPVDFGKGLTVVCITVLACRSYLYHFTLCSERILWAEVAMFLRVCVYVCDRVIVNACVSKNVDMHFK